MRTLQRTLALAAVLALTAEQLRAQDIEFQAAAAGLTLPPAYFELIHAEPDFFTVRPAWVHKAAGAAVRGAALEGELKVIVVQALHADSPDPAFTADDLARVYFTGPYAYGTLAEYYHEVSGGRLAVTGTVTDWVRTSLTRSDVVGTSYGLGSGTRVGEYLVEALDSVDVSVDFGLYDNDGPDGRPNSGDDDGVVDLVAFQFIEVAASCRGPGIWPHRSSIRGRTGSEYVTDDVQPSGASISVNGYTIQSVVDCSGTTITTAGTMAHELGHAIGLPDYRHHVGGVEPQYRRWLLGCWALMSGGSWGCADVPSSLWVRPPHMSPIAKLELGWLGNVIDVTPAELHEFALAPVQTSEQVLRVPLQGFDEFLLVEFRDKIGFDLALPAAGVLVYHMEPARSYPCDDCERLYPFVLIEADGRGDLLRTALEGGNIGEASDVFGALGPVSFTNYTNPSTQLNSGEPSTVDFYRIAVDGGVAAISLSTAETSVDRLAEPFLLGGAVPLTDGEKAFFDLLGNSNGRYDVGDLRARLNP